MINAHPELLCADSRHIPALSSRMSHETLIKRFLRNQQAALAQLLQSVRAHCRPRASHLQLLRHLAYAELSAKRCSDIGAHLCSDAGEAINFQRPALLCQRQRSSLRSVHLHQD
jgi:hypothetical protein